MRDSDTTCGSDAEVFAREGDYWTIVFSGRVSRVRHSKGMGYLAELLTRPGDEVPAFELTGLPIVEGDAGPVLDETALRRYRSRYRELRADLDEAERDGDAERVARLGVEIEALAAQLKTGLGLGGRRRRSGSPIERARLAATKALRAALVRINEVDPVLGAHLAATVHTGTSCCYRPDPRAPVAWRDRRPPGIEVAPRQDVRPDGPGRDPSPSPRFVGRARELAQLGRLVRAADEGRGAVVLIGGDPGVGKSRLVDEALRRQQEQTGTQSIAYVGRCLESGATVAHLPFVEITDALVARIGDTALREVAGEGVTEIARLAPSVGRALGVSVTRSDLPADQARRVLFDTVVQTLVRLADGATHVLVIEDLHWADPATLALLEHLSDHVRGRRLVIVATHRLAEASPGMPLARAIERIARSESLTRIVLEPLSPGEVDELVAAMHGGPPPPEVLGRVGTDSGGNPLFVTQLYRHLAERDALDGGVGADLPDTLRLVLLNRVSRLSSDAQRVLALAAVAGHDVDESLLRAAGEDADRVLDALDEAVRARLLVDAPAPPPGGDCYRFVHALVRQAILGELTPGRRRRLHLRIANAIESLHGLAVDHAAELADHLERAGNEVDGAREAAAQRRAARRQLDVAAHDAALRRLDRALARCPAAAELLRVEVLADRGDALAALGRLDDALADWRAALARAEQLPGGGDVAGQICERLGTSLDLVGAVPEAVNIVRRGLAHVGPEPSVVRGRLLATLCHPLSLLGRHDEAAVLLDEARVIASRCDDIRMRGQIEASAGILSFTTGDHVSGAAHARAASDLLVEGGALWAASVPAAMVPLNCLYIGDVESAAEATARCEEMFARSGHLAAAGWAARSAAWLELMRTGDVDEFACRGNADLVICRDHHLRWLADSLVNAGMAAFWRGDIDTALEMLGEAATRPCPPVYVGRYSSALLVVHAWRGDASSFLQARDAIERELDTVGLAGRPTMGTQIFELSALEGCALLGDWAGAAELAPRVESILARGIALRPSDFRLVIAVAALAAAATGDRRLARARLAEARRLTEVLPHRRDACDLERFAAAID